MRFFDIKWTISGARDSYGYNVCSLWEKKKKVTSCKGGGYDMMGTCLGDWLEINYKGDLKKLRAPNFYGLTFVKKKKNGGYTYLKTYRPGCNIGLDGACGWDCMVRIAKAIKLTITRTHNSTDLQSYTVTGREDDD